MDYINEYHILCMIENNIRYYQYMIKTCKNPCETVLYENLLNTEKNRYYHLFGQYQLKNNLNYDIYKTDIKQFTIEELSQYNGSNDMPAYVAVNGIVYDVSLEITLGGGTHFGMYAGQNLTGQFNACHGGITDILKDLSKVGLL